MANTDVVLVMLPGTEQLLSEQLWLDVLSSFRRHPSAPAPPAPPPPHTVTDTCVTDWTNGLRCHVQS
jgi:hypothetical protein